MKFLSCELGYIALYKFGWNADINTSIDEFHHNILPFHSLKTS